MLTSGNKLGSFPRQMKNRYKLLKLEKKRYQYLGNCFYSFHTIIPISDCMLDTIRIPLLSENCYLLLLSKIICSIFQRKIVLDKFHGNQNCR